MSFNQIRASDLVLVDHEGIVLHGDRVVNRAAFVIHSQVHKARPDVLAAAHAHSLHGKAFSALGVPLDPITQDACAFFEDQGLYDSFGGVVYDVEEGKRVACGWRRGPGRPGPPRSATPWCSPRSPRTSACWMTCSPTPPQEPLHRRPPHLLDGPGRPARRLSRGIPDAHQGRDSRLTTPESRSAPWPRLRGPGG
jgi:hypothetical protein